MSEREWNQLPVHMVGVVCAICDTPGRYDYEACYRAIMDFFDRKENGYKAQIQDLTESCDKLASKIARMEYEANKCVECCGTGRKP